MGALVQAWAAAGQKLTGARCEQAGATQTAAQGDAVALQPQVCMRPLKLQVHTARTPPTTQGAPDGIVDQLREGGEDEAQALQPLGRCLHNDRLVEVICGGERDEQGAVGSDEQYPADGQRR